MGQLRITHKEIVRLNKLAHELDSEIFKNHPSIRQILITRKLYAKSICYKSVDESLSEQVINDLLDKIEYLDNQIKQFYGIK